MASFEYLSYDDQSAGEVPHLLSWNLIIGTAIGIGIGVGSMVALLLLSYFVAEYWNRFKRQIGKNEVELSVFRHYKSVISKDQIQDDCVICLEGFYNQPELVMARHCKHIFHLTCIVEWFAHKKSCPICRQTVERLVGCYIVEDSATSADYLESCGMEIV